MTISERVSDLISAWMGFILAGIGATMGTYFAPPGATVDQYLWFAGTFALAVFFKFADIGATAGYIAAAGFPLAGLLAWLAAFFELALVIAFLTGAWFREAAPRRGFGVGAVPWCGHSPGSACGGVPTQIHSDYTFTAITGVYGQAAAWVAALGAAWWLHRLVRRHGQVTRGEPRLVECSGRWVPEGQALLSWVALAWVALTLCQLAVTVAGNLAVLPLTGVTFPFVSYGMTSLVVNMAFLALALNVDVPVAQRNGGGDD